MAKTKEDVSSGSDVDSNTVSGELKVEKVSKPKAPKMVTLVFRGNRKFDLHVGREVVVFEGRVAKQVPVEWLSHRDFKQVSKYFTVKGV